MLLAGPTSALAQRPNIVVIMSHDQADGDATLGFLRGKIPRNWADLCDSVTDNFRIINPKYFRAVTSTEYT